MGNESELLNGLPLQLHRTHLWEYFELHANQRINLFRFYTLIVGLFITSSGFVLIRIPGSKDALDEVMVIVLSIVFINLTVVFQLLDRRNRQLIHYSEKKIMEFERKYLDDVSRIFSIESNEKISGMSYVGHSACFRWIFCVGYCLAGVILIYCCFNAGLCK